MQTDAIPQLPEPSSALHWSVMLLLVVLYTVVFVMALVTAWKIYARTGQPGWSAFIPIYSTYVLTLIVNRPLSWFVLSLIPCVAPFVSVVLVVDLYKAFGRPAWAPFIPLYNFIVAMQMAFGDAQYRKPSRLPSR